MSETAKDPQRGQLWEHIDGGSLFVVARTPKRLTISRKYPYDSYAAWHWMRLSTFEKVATIHSGEWKR